MEVILDPTKTVDMNEIDVCDLKITTKYCVDTDIHKQQVISALQRNLPPIPVVMETTYNPIAVVCSGPSLKETWETIRKFDKIISCSGAHDFLIERGIIPTYHMETDPREHKAKFVANARKDVKYFIASCCHPAVFDALEGYEVYIWNVLTNKDEDALYREGDWVLTGGSNVGLRALVMARLLGHTVVHVFGMDCSADEDGFRAGPHPNPIKEKAKRFVKVGEQTFTTTEVYLEYARQFFWETLLLGDTNFVLHGDGLLQNLAVSKVTDPEQIKKRLAQLKAQQDKPNTIAYCKGKGNSGNHNQPT